MSNPPLGIVTPLGYLLNDALGSPMSPPRGPMGGGAFIVARRGTVLVYVTPGPYLPIAKSRYEGFGLSVKPPLGYCTPPRVFAERRSGVPHESSYGFHGWRCIYSSAAGHCIRYACPYLPIAKGLTFMSIF